MSKSKTQTAAKTQEQKVDSSFAKIQPENIAQDKQFGESKLELENKPANDQGEVSGGQIDKEQSESSKLELENKPANDQIEVSDGQIDKEQSEPSKLELENKPANDQGEAIDGQTDKEQNVPSKAEAEKQNASAKGEATGGQKERGIGLPDDLVEKIIAQTASELPRHIGRSGNMLAASMISPKSISEAGHILKLMLKNS